MKDANRENVGPQGRSTSWLLRMVDPLPPRGIRPNSRSFMEPASLEEPSVPAKVYPTRMTIGTP